MTGMIITLLEIFSEQLKGSSISVALRTFICHYLCQCEIPEPAVLLSKNCLINFHVEVCSSLLEYLKQKINGFNFDSLLFNHSFYQSFPVYHPILLCYTKNVFFWLRQEQLKLDIRSFRIDLLNN